MIINGVERDYIVHNENEILGFFGEYRFLSNFEICPVYFEGELYESTENAFMAAKTLDIEERRLFKGISPKDAKALGRKIQLRPDWEEVKYGVMASVCFDKFFRNAKLRSKLLATGDARLSERNHWSDKVWGTDEEGNGKNALGKILMDIRTALRTCENLKD